MPSPNCSHVGQSVRFLASWLLVACASPLFADDWKDAIESLAADHAGQVAVCVKHLDSGESFEFRADQPMPTASLIKLAVMVETYRQAEAGRIDMAAMLTLREEDKAPGSGLLTPHFSAGATLSLRDAVRLMIAVSDNTATNLVIDRVGLKAVNQTMHDLGLPNTRIYAKVFRRDTSIDPERSEKFGLGSTTAAETVRLLQQLHADELASVESCAAMLAHLRTCDDRARLPKLLPAKVRIAHKTGSVEKVRTAAGIVDSPCGPFAICVLTAENQDTRWADDNAANDLIARVAKIAYDHFADADSDAAGEDEPLPAPEQVNQENLSLSPADDLDGPPQVTCKAWAIADGTSGELLYGMNQDQPLDNASTTKIMTALVVLKLAREKPSLLEEVVTFSKRADRTIGSTAGIKAGEKLSAGELLYGLLLPSGNDASVALAEHFGKRFDPPSEAAPANSAGGDEPAKQSRAKDGPIDRFVAEMNREAERLGLKQTAFKNTSGLTAEGHHASAGDLLRLAHAAWQNPLFREYVSTRQRGCTLDCGDGKTRNVVWKNTNNLLPIEGYDGVKTGTTDAAGACLVASGRRGDDHLLVVVLGAANSDARYVDARNLFRWAWRMRK